MMGKQVATGRLPRKMVTNGFCPAPAPPAAPLPPEKVSHQIKGAKEKLLKLSQMRSNETSKKTVPTYKKMVGP